MSSNLIFISHAEVNKNLADKLVNLLETGIGIQDSDIFCSSLEGLGIPSGKNFVDFIHEKISDPKVVILLLTPEYYNSIFCLCELGASWILSHNIMPLLVPPLGYNDVKDVLTGIQVLKIDDNEKLNTMRDELVKVLKIKGKPFARWELRRNDFLDELNKYLETYTPIKKISNEEYDKLLSNYNDAREEIKSLDSEISEKDDLIEKLKKTKDSKEVMEVINKSNDLEQQFHTLVNEANSKLSLLPHIVCEFLFKYYVNNGKILMTNEIINNYGQEIEDAIENNYVVRLDSNLFEIIEDEPKISKALLTLNKLNDFLNFDEYPDSDVENIQNFEEYYKNKYNHLLKFTSKQFWKEHLL